MKSKLIFLVLAGVFFAGPLKADISDVIAKVKPSVVLVGSFKSTNSPRFTLKGAGFVVGDGNQLVTNAHVIQVASFEDEDIQWAIQIKNGQNEFQMRRAAVMEVDKLHDLALLRFEGNALPPLSLRDSGVREGQSIAFTGYPIGSALGFRR